VKKNDYKRAFLKMEPDQAFKERLAEKVQSKTPTMFQKRNKRFMASFVGALILVAGFGLFSNLNGQDTPNESETSPVEQNVAEGAVFIPQIELPKQSGVAMDMIGLIVYQGKVYTQTDTLVPKDSAKQLLEEKIGRTKGNIDEWSSQDDYADELASSIGEMDVYKVKGYGSDFRIMTYEEINGDIWAEFYECLNGIEVRSGADLFEKLKMVGNVESAKWEAFESWNNSGQVYEDVPVDATLEEFLLALNAAKPIEQEPLQQEGIYESAEQKFILIKLKDQTEIRLRLFKEGGYVKYGFAPVFLKVEDETFAKMWESL
jgi:hypothetical protein